MVNGGQFVTLDSMRRLETLSAEISVTERSRGSWEGLDSAEELEQFTSPNFGVCVNVCECIILAWTAVV